MEQYNDNYTDVEGITKALEEVFGPFEVPKKTIDNNKTSFNAFELYNKEVVELPKLLDPFLQSVGLASLVGESDSGKSTLLRQLCIDIALKKDTFLGFKLNAKQNKVLYVSTEDNPDSLSFSIKKQIELLHPNIDTNELKNLNNLEFIFDPNQLLEYLKNRLKKNPVDLIVIDAFTDVFTKEINSNTQVRNFLNTYDKLAKENNCLIIFLHHIGKRAENKEANKNNVIGSQGFEAKMRVVLQLKKRGSSSSIRDLWILKSNFLNNSHKKNSYVLNFSSGFTFSNTLQRGSKISSSKTNDNELLKKIIPLREQKTPMSYRKIEEKFKGTKYETGKSTIAKIYNDYLDSKKGS
jgi:RecA-family ATPase